MMKQTANVSIVAANYNNGNYLKDFINSINESTVIPKELFIIDDGSTDDSLKILEGFSGLAYLKIIKFQKNRGFCEALNAGIKNASGDYIMRVDPDDIILPNRIETQVRILENNKDIDVLGSNVVYFNSDTKKEVFRSNFPLDHLSIKLTYRKGEHGVQHPSTMIRTRVMKQYKYNQKNVLADDYDLFARIINDGYKYANVKEPLTRMRIHNKSFSNNIRYQSIRLTYQLRDSIFNTSTSRVKIRLYFWYILNYRKFLISQNIVLKTVYLFLSILFYPSKFWRRVF